MYVQYNTQSQTWKFKWLFFKCPKVSSTKSLFFRRNFCKELQTPVLRHMIIHVHAFLPKSTTQSLLKKNVVNEKTNSLVVPGRSYSVNPELP